jgi:hypothetical protein
MEDYKAGDQVIVFKDYGRKYSISKVESVYYSTTTLESGESINSYPSDGISIFKYDETIMGDILYAYRLKKAIYALNYNSKLRAKVPKDILSQLEEAVGIDEIESMVKSGLSMGSLEKESSFINKHFKEKS